MPVRTRSVADRHADDEQYQKLRARLVAEWSRKKGPRPLPDILEEKDARGRIVHVTVTWDAWADLDAQTRSEIIVEAFQEVKGEAAIVDLALAMGLTSAEADRLMKVGRR